MHFEQRLDPELRTALAAMPSLGDLTADVARARVAIAEMFAAFQVAPPEHITIENRSLPGPQGAPEVVVRLSAAGKTSIQQTTKGAISVFLS